MLANSSNAWQLDKILPDSHWPARLFYAGWGLALLAIILSGLMLSWKLGLITLACLLMLLRHKKQIHIRTISISEQHCVLRTSGKETIELEPPYHSTQFIWWASLYQKKGFTGRWFWLYRDQFSEDEWRHLSVLLRWSH